jgi:predicted RNA-binding protein YlqC (UPF0109 family)
MLDFLSRLKPPSRDDAPEDDLVALVRDVARSLVEHPDRVRVEAVDGSSTTAIELRVAAEDLGRVIGKKGRTATAIRTLLSAAGTRSGRKYLLEILD